MLSIRPLKNQVCETYHELKEEKFVEHCSAHEVKNHETGFKIINHPEFIVENIAQLSLVKVGIVGYPVAEDESSEGQKEEEEEDGKPRTVLLHPLVCRGRRIEECTHLEQGNKGEIGYGCGDHLLF